MRVITVPPNKIPVRYEEEEKITIKEENFFWFMLKSILRRQVSSMSGLDVLQYEDLHKEIDSQDGKPVLKITRETEYEKVKTWIENYKGYPGKVEDVTAMIRAFRAAEKVTDKDKK